MLKPVMGACEHGTSFVPDNLLLMEKPDSQEAIENLAGELGSMPHVADGALTLLHEDVVLLWHELTERPTPGTPVIKRRLVTRPKPAPDHPWRKPIHAAQGRQAESARTYASQVTAY